MYCQLGTILFENLKTFTEYSKTGASVFAEHPLVDGKPRLQKTGLSLSEISLQIRFHASFCNPANELDKLKTSRDSAEILPLLYGNGKLEGDFVITEVSEVVEDADSQGNIFSYNVSISLKEYIVPDKLQQEQSESRANAKAVGNKKPVAKKKINPETCSQTITGIVSQINSHANYVNKTVQTRVNNALTVDTQTRGSILSQLKSIENYNTDLLKRCNDSASCASEHPGLKFASANVTDSVAKFTVATDVSIVPQMISENQNLMAAVKSLLAANRTLSNDAITRK